METTTDTAAVPTFTAIKTWKGDKATVHVYDEQGAEVAKLGGKRAARATAVIMSRFDGTTWRWAKEPGGEVETEVPYSKTGAHGLRADMAKAQSEAAGLYRTEMRTRYGLVPLKPCTWAVAIPVTDAQA